MFEHIIVSTDDSEVAAVAEVHGASVPFMRPSELADDFTTTVRVVSHTAHWMQRMHWSVDAICCLYPANPFLQPADLRNGRTLLGSEWSYVMSATEFNAPVQRGFVRRETGEIAMLFPEEAGTRSQDLPPVLHDAAQFYWGHMESWLNEAPLLGPNTRAVMIPKWRVHDIDTIDDWRRAELIYEALRREGEFTSISVGGNQ